MSRRRKLRRAPPGSSPGTLAIEPDAPASRIRLMAYGPEGLDERPLTGAADAAGVRGTRPVCWIDVDGLGDEPLLRGLAERFSIHPLALADIANVHQRAKVDPYPDQLFIVLRMPEPAGETEQLSMVLGRDYLITFQEKPGGDCLDAVRARLRAPHSTTRRRGADYLAYALLDAAIDAYFPVLEAQGDRLESLEAEILAGGDSSVLNRLHDLKRDLLRLRRAIWPLREATAQLLRGDCPLIGEETRVFLRDCHDHAVQLIDLTENYRELAADLTDLHLSVVSNRMNEVMKVLTLISTVFLPLSFIAGVYGMNFEHMPELRWPGGYLFAWILMTGVALTMLVWFRRKGWLGRR